MLKSTIAPLCGIVMLSLGWAVQAGGPARGATTVSGPTYVDKVYEPVYVFDPKTQAVHMQMPEGATVIAEIFQPAPGRKCGERTNWTGMTPVEMTGTLCVSAFGSMSVGKGSALVGDTSAVGGWAESVTLVYLFKGKIGTIQVSLPVIPYTPPKFMYTITGSFFNPGKTVGLSLANPTLRLCTGSGKADDASCTEPATPANTGLTIQRIQEIQQGLLNQLTACNTTEFCYSSFADV